jgi:hypothetical protein
MNEELDQGDHEQFHPKGREEKQEGKSSSADVSTSNKEPPLIPMTSPSSQRDGGEGEEEAEELLGGDRREREGSSEI